MTKKVINDATLEAIADAIREKTGDSNAMTPLEMPTEIENIPTGGMDETFKNLMNGTATGVVTLSGSDYVNMGSIMITLGANRNSVTELHLPNTENFDSFSANGGLISYDTSGNSVLQVLDIPKCKSIYLNNNTRSTSQGSFTNLTTINAPKLEKIGGLLRSSQIVDLYLPELKSCNLQIYNVQSLKTIKFPKFQNPTINSWLQYCSNVERAEFGNNSLGGTNVYFRAGTFNGTALNALVLRYNTNANLSNANALANTPIASGTGYIYVPRALINTYQSATNWTTYSSNFRAIEDYTVDGTIDGEFVPPTS